MGMTTTQQIWTQQFAALADALKPFVFSIDGEEFVNSEAPLSLVAPYRSLLSVGYAKGWL